MKGREATTAHPLCTCREHDHQLDRCLGPEFIYRRPDGTEHAGTCRILGGVEPSTRDRCVMHGRPRHVLVPREHSMNEASGAYVAPPPLTAVTVQVTMTVLVEDADQAVAVAQRWLPYQRELPLGCSDGATLTSVEVRRAT